MSAAAATHQLLLDVLYTIIATTVCERATVCWASRVSSLNPVVSSSLSSSAGPPAVFNPHYPKPVEIKHKTGSAWYIGCARCMVDFGCTPKSKCTAQGEVAIALPACLILMDSAVSHAHADRC